MTVHVCTFRCRCVHQPCTRLERLLVTLPNERIIPQTSTTASHENSSHTCTTPVPSSDRQELLRPPFHAALHWRCNFFIFYCFSGVFRKLWLHSAVWFACSIRSSPSQPIRLQKKNNNAQLQPCNATTIHYLRQQVRHVTTHPPFTTLNPSFISKVLICVVNNIILYSFLLQSSAISFVSQLWHFHVYLIFLPWVYMQVLSFSGQHDYSYMYDWVMFEAPGAVHIV